MFFRYYTTATWLYEENQKHLIKPYRIGLYYYKNKKKRKEEKLHNLHYILANKRPLNVQSCKP